MEYVQKLTEYSAYFFASLTTHLGAGQKSMLHLCLTSYCESNSAELIKGRLELQSQRPLTLPQAAK